MDNNCNGQIDVADPACTAPEKCNGLDDDNDGVADNGFALGVPCTVGTGICQKSGVTICDPADQTQTKCSVSPGGPVVEGPPGSAKCTDGLDNDCDGFTDIADANCQEPEKCDGLDNDGNGVIDNGFPDKGQACSTGVGACQSAGVKVCSPDGMTTTCNAVAKLATTEGPTGLTCGDGIDNDCDGHTDGADPDCNVADLFATCDLPYLKGNVDPRDCDGRHTIVFHAGGGTSGAVVTAELLALSENGSLLGSLPVQNGDEARIKSRVSPKLFKLLSNKTGHGTRHEISAPIPLLRVRIEDNGNRVEAYCSNIPFLRVIKPSGEVVSTSDGDVMRVVAAIPRVNPADLLVKVDGVDLFAALGIDPSTQFPGGPYNGNVMIHGHSVEVTDLLVQTAPLGTESPNTLTMTLKNLGGGGHIVVVDSDPAPGSIAKMPSPKCHLDDVRDKGSMSVLGITIDAPTEGEITSTVPTPVQGLVSSGRPIASTRLNGLPLDVSTQMFTPGDGENSSDQYVYPIDEALNQTNLAQDISSGDEPLGTLDLGSNRLVAEATDDQGNRAFATRIFAVGDVEQAGSAASSVAASLAPDQQAQVASTVKAEVKGSIRNALSSTEIPNAFVLGLKPEAINAFFHETCVQATADTEAKVRASLLAKVFPPKNVNGGISCNPNVNTSITSVSFNGNLSCNVTLGNQFITVNVGIPPVLVGIHAYGRCETDDPVFGICLAETIVDVDGTGTLSNMTVNFPITETQFTAGGDSTGTFVPGTATVLITRDGSEVNCLAGFIADVISGFVNFLVTIFTFGQVDAGFDLTPTFDGIFKEIDLTEKYGVSDFTVKIKDIKPNAQEVANVMKKLDVSLDNVKIRPEGLTAVLKGTFSSTSTDPEIETTPGAVRVNPSIPMPPAPGAANTFFVVNVDALNQLFASMTTQGELKTICKPSGSTVASLLPADCDSLTGETAVATAVLVGACHGAKGDDCAPLPIAKQLACNTTKTQLANRNISGSTPLLFCARTDIPPRLLIQDNGATQTKVETTLRLNDLLVGVVLDRDANAILGGELNATPKCFQADAPTSGDCKLAATCLDLNFPTDLVLDTTGGKLKIVPQIHPPQTLSRPPGAICDGGVNFGGDGNLLGDASASDPIDDLMMSVDTLTPPLQSEGLDLGGVVTFSSPRLFAIDQGDDPAFQEFLGLTGDIVP